MLPGRVYRQRGKNSGHVKGPMVAKKVARDSAAVSITANILRHARRLSGTATLFSPNPLIGSSGAGRGRGRRILPASAWRHRFPGGCDYPSRRASAIAGHPATNYGQSCKMLLGPCFRSVEITVSTKYLPILLWFCWRGRRCHTVWHSHWRSCTPTVAGAIQPAYRQRKGSIHLQLIFLSCSVHATSWSVRCRSVCGISCRQAFRYDLLWYFGNVFSTWHSSVISLALAERVFISICPFSRLGSATGTRWPGSRWVCCLPTSPAGESLDQAQKVPAFWAFHAVHHSQTELNILPTHEAVR